MFGSWEIIQSFFLSPLSPVYSNRDTHRSDPNIQSFCSWAIGPFCFPTPNNTRGSHLPSTLRGILFFSNTRCPPCAAAVPAPQRAATSSLWSFLSPPPSTAAPESIILTALFRRRSTGSSTSLCCPSQEASIVLCWVATLTAAPFQHGRKDWHRWQKGN